MIWVLVQKDQPVVRHYLFVSPANRGYAAYETDHGRLVRLTARTADPEFPEGTPLDPMEYQIRFTSVFWTWHPLDVLTSRRPR
ncbi:hypothetical protein F5Y19DRAFT_460581 [Xylariaceae sp. FL1651]|nr:hypothetical protein F5Y19DRAFT_460581 [Xylariaceae sp. FL1651]